MVPFRRVGFTHTKIPTLGLIPHRLQVHLVKYPRWVVEGIHKREINRNAIVILTTIVSSMVLILCPSFRFPIKQNFYVLFTN